MLISPVSSLSHLSLYNMKQRNKILLIYSSTLIGIILWLGVVFMAPYLKSQSSDLNKFFYDIFSPICHQIQSRSFFLFGYPLAVCTRCFGIYVGFFVGTGLFPFLKGFSNLNLPKTKIFIFMSLPIAFDFIGNLLHFWVTPNWLRFITGFLWGKILPFYFIIGLTDLILKSARTKDNKTQKAKTV